MARIEIKLTGETYPDMELTLCRSREDPAYYELISEVTADWPLSCGDAYKLTIHESLVHHIATAFIYTKTNLLMEEAKEFLKEPSKFKIVRVTEDAVNAR